MTWKGQCHARESGHPDLAVRAGAPDSRFRGNDTTPRDLILNDASHSSLSSDRLSRLAPRQDVLLAQKHFFGTFILLLTEFGTFVTYRSDAPEDRRMRKMQGGTVKLAIVATFRASPRCSPRRARGAPISENPGHLDRAPRAATRYTALSKESVAYAR